MLNSMLEIRSKRYLIDGFPRELDQALFFESKILEFQNILYFNAPEEVLVERIMKRGKTSGRSDDSKEIITKRIAVFNSNTMKVIDFYRRFGKVCEIQAVGGIEEVYERTKRALIPRFDFLIGPPGSNEVTKLLA